MVLRTFPENPGWDREDIKHAVRKRGSTLSEIARRIGLSPTSMSYALEKRHPRANQAIADFIRVPLHELWPAFYPAPPAKTTPENAPLSRKKAS
ncbi:helix-turn-helix domain-containing protein [Rhodoblastus acidophilus]|uniref:helix-turn-helix domain-containing protein n=1 Tax=Rhodoblastus acidophilus TaxID=1074 RepID=UPI003CC88C0D